MVSGRGTAHYRLGQLQMIRKSLLASVALAALSAHAAHSQTSIAQPVVIGGQAPLTSTTTDTTGPKWQPTNGTPLEAAVSCGIVSTQALTASSASVFVMIQNPTSNSIWLDLTGAAATTGAPSYLLGATATLMLSVGAGFVPTNAINCSATVTSSISVVYK
jgi:hypothetical protein